MLLFSKSESDIIVQLWRICVSFDNQPLAKVIALDDMHCHKRRLWNMNHAIQ